MRITNFVIKKLTYLHIRIQLYFVFLPSIHLVICINYYFGPSHYYFYLWHKEGNVKKNKYYINIEKFYCKNINLNRLKR